MKPHTLIALVALAAAGGTAIAAGNHAGSHGHGSDDAIGVPGKANQVSRTVAVDMTDTMRFIPGSIRVKQGETVRFRVKNSGQLKHEFVLGTDKDLKEHYQVMLQHPEMEHDEPNMITLAGGKTGEVIWRFTKSGKVDFACLQPGHYDAGMKGAVSVAKLGAKPGAASGSPAASKATPARPHTPSN